MSTENEKGGFSNPNYPMDEPPPYQPASGNYSPYPTQPNAGQWPNQGTCNQPTQQQTSVNVTIGTITAVVGMIRYLCAYCQNPFLINTRTTGSFVKCPHCKRVSATSKSAVQTRAAIYFSLGIFFLLAGIGVTVGTYETASYYGGIYVAWIGAFVVGIANLIRGGYMLSFKTSYALQ